MSEKESIKELKRQIRIYYLLFLILTGAMIVVYVDKDTKLANWLVGMHVEETIKEEIYEACYYGCINEPERNYHYECVSMCKDYARLNDE